MYSSGKGPAREGPGRREHTDYSGEWQSNGIVSWASERFPNKVTKLNADTYKKRVLNGKNTWLVAYSAPSWCAPCRAYQSTLRRIAYLLRHDNLKVGWLDCDSNKETCNNLGISVRFFCLKKQQPSSLPPSLPFICHLPLRMQLTSQY